MIDIGSVIALEVDCILLCTSTPPLHSFFLHSLVQTTRCAELLLTTMHFSNILATALLASTAATLPLLASTELSSAGHLRPRELVTRELEVRDILEHLNTFERRQTIGGLLGGDDGGNSADSPTGSSTSDSSLGGSTSSSETSSNVTSSSSSTSCGMSSSEPGTY